MSSIRIRRPIRAPPSEEKQQQEQEQNPQVGISFFKMGSRQQFMDSSKRYLGHTTKVNVLKPGDWVLLYDLDTCEVFGICILRTINGNCIWREAHPYDTGIYSAEYIKYNKYEIGVKTIIFTPTHVKTITRASGLDEETLRHHLGTYPHLGSFRCIPYPILPWIHQAIAEAWRQEP